VRLLYGKKYTGATIEVFYIVFKGQGGEDEVKVVVGVYKHD
jgi:hypothetical protein